MPTDTAVRFTVLGRPQTQGSVRAFVVNGHARLTSDNAKMKPWRQEVGWRALEAMQGADLFPRGVAVALTVTFYLERPKSLPKGRAGRDTEAC